MGMCMATVVGTEAKQYTSSAPFEYSPGHAIPVATEALLVGQGMSTLRDYVSDTAQRFCQ